MNSSLCGARMKRETSGLVPYNKLPACCLAGSEASQHLQAGSLQYRILKPFFQTEEGILINLGG